ncbi:hypothetical protein BCR44DRAFT_39563 [Catenaria anguillulae PL171]|uniref:25S rRNA (uridine-N(3))-methyltransferase BMT5-like domain-containing protein n=1 Tax=Catenaria anguillulae PL171 TaxID=765915 RepID=A0A1Y2HSP7_9FUNG|nr:hypothetical protein BCR44DRAFT_39563 [Catenaria anguillulae PL171]
MAPKKNKLTAQLGKLIAQQQKKAPKGPSRHLPKTKAEKEQLSKQQRAQTKAKGNKDAIEAEDSVPTLESDANASLAVHDSDADDDVKPTSTPSTSTAGSKRKDIIPYTLSDSILLVGEGNFSFALGLASLLGTGANILATAYDSKQVVVDKYADAAAIIQDFESTFEGQCMYDVDATKLDKCTGIKGKAFDKIVFNFPHVGLGIKDQDRNIRANQQLLLGFFKSSLPVSNVKTEIIVTLKTGNPYDLWTIKRLAKSCGLVTKRSFPFHPDPYMGYEHRRTLGHDASLSASANAEIKNAKTYVFGTASDELMAKIDTARAEKIKKRKSKHEADAFGSRKRAKKAAGGGAWSDDD